MANMGIEIEIYKDTDPFSVLGVLERRKEPTILREVRAHGAGSFKIAKSDPKLIEDPTLLRYRNFVRVKDNGRVVGGFIIQTKTDTIVGEGEAAEEAYLVSGEGLRAWSRDAGIHPAGGLKATSRETRFFNFASERGAWYRDADWKNTVIQAPWNTSKHYRYTAPANWPDAPSANWIWDRDIPEWNYPVGSAYLRREFTVTEKGQYSLFFAVDDVAEVYMDGELVHTTAEHAWEETTRQDFDLDVGDHVLAFKITNSAITIGPASVIAAFFKVGSPGAPTAATLMFVSDTQWLISAYPDTPPGWTPGNILLTLLDEAKDRGVRFASNVTPTFGHTVDSAGVVWANRIALSFTIGSATLEDVISALEESACDVYLDPETLQLHAVQRRGVDRSTDEVWIEQRRNLVTNPRGVNNSVYFGPAHKGAFSYRTDMTGDTTTAVRWTRTEEGIAGARPIVLGSDTPHEGQDVSFRARVRLSHAARVTVSIRPDVKSETNQSTLGTFDLPAGVSEVSVSGKTYSGPTTSDAGVLLSLGAGGLPVGGYLDATVMQVVEAATPGNYFDGTVAPSSATTRNRWLGTSNRSMSVQEVLTSAEPVILRPAWNLISASQTGQAEIVNSLMLRTADGWSIETPDDTASQDLYGTVEGQISTELSKANAAPLVTELFTLKSLPEKSATFVLHPREGSTPVVDFLEGDYLSAPSDVPDTLEKRRVMSISASEGESGEAVYAIEFDTIFKDSQATLEKYLQRQANSSALGTGFTNSSSTPSTATKGTPPSGLPQRAPDAPAGLTVSTVGRWADSGQAVSDYGLVWNPVTTSRDVPISDVEKYEIWGKKSSELSFALLRTVFDAVGYLSNFNPGETWDFRVRAYARTGGYGPFTAAVSLKADQPNVPLPKPSAPTLITELGVVAAKWDGLLGGSATPSRYKTMELQRAATQTGTYATVASFITGSGLDSTGVVGSTYWYRFVPVDFVGVKGTPSDPRSIKVAGVSTAELDDAINDAINGANATASAALTSANGKGRNIYGTAAQRDTYAPFNEFDVWYDTANGNRMSRWSGSAWSTVLLDGSALSGKAIDFSKIADEVTNKINQGISDAATAQATANTAATAANGKGRNITGTSTYRDTKAPFSEFDTWYDTATGNRAHRWSGSAWVAISPTRNALAQDVNDSIDGALQKGLDAQAGVNAALTKSLNRVTDPSFGSGVMSGLTGGWFIDSTTGRSDNFSLSRPGLSGFSGVVLTQVAGSDNNAYLHIPVSPGETWEVGGWVKTTADYNGTLNNSKLRLGSQTGALLSAVAVSTPKTEWTWVSTRFAVPADNSVLALRLTVVADHTVGQVWWDDVVLRNVSDAVTAESALSSANGKNSSTYAQTAPVGSGKTDGDLWWQMNGNLVTKVFTWVAASSGWIERAYDGNVLKNIDAGSITVGVLNAARLAADSITVDKLLVANFTNLLEDPSFEVSDLSTAWAVGSSAAARSTTSPRGGGGHLRVKASTAVFEVVRQKSGFRVEPGEKYRFSGWVRMETSSMVGVAQGIELSVTGRNTPDSAATAYAVASSVAGLSTTYTLVTGVWTVPSNIFFAQPRVVVRGDTGNTNVYLVDDLFFQKMASSEMIVDGSITATQMATGTITAASGIIADAAITNAKISSLDAAKISAGTLDAARIAATSISAQKLIMSDFTNLIGENYGFEYGSAGWNLTAGASIVDIGAANTLAGGSKVAQVVAQGAVTDVNSSIIATNPGDVWYVECLLRKTQDGVSGIVGIQATFRLDGANPSYSNIQTVPMSTLVQSQWAKVSGFVTTPPSRNQMVVRPTVRADVSSGQTIQFDNVIVRKASSAELIVDGSISATKMVAGTLTAASGIIADAAIKTANIQDAAITNAKVASLDAAKISTGFLGTDRLDANSIRAEKLLLATLDNQLDNPNFLANAQTASQWAGWVRSNATAWMIPTSGSSAIDNYLQRVNSASTPAATVTNTFRVAVRAGQRVRTDFQGHFSNLPVAAWTTRRRNYVTDPNMTSTSSLSYLLNVEASAINIDAATSAIRLVRTSTAETRVGLEVGATSRVPTGTPMRVRLRVRAQKAVVVNIYLRPIHAGDSTNQTTVASAVTVPAGITTQVFEATTGSGSTFTASSALAISMTDGAVGDYFDIISADVGRVDQQVWGPNTVLTGDLTSANDTERFTWVGAPNDSQSLYESRVSYASIGPVFYKADGTELSYVPKVLEGNTGWTPYSWETNVPDNACFASLRVYDSGYTGATNRWANLQFRLMGAAQLLVDGEIEARHIRVGSLTGDRMKAGTISVDQLEPNIGEAIKITGNAEIAAIKKVTDSQQDSITSHDQRIMETNAAVTKAAASASQANSGVSALNSRADQLQAGISTAQSGLDDMGRTYRFTTAGAFIGSPGSAYEFVLQNTGAEIRYNGVPVSSWDAGRMIVNSFVGNEVVLGNHKLEKDATTGGTVVRKIAS